MVISDKTVVSIEKTDSCRLDNENTYEVYIPAREHANTKLPLLIVLDSHGSGKFALSHFKLGAEQFPAIVVASNRIQNGFEDYENAIQTLIADVRTKYPANEELYISGFSGGARMALGYALLHSVKGLILCGALADQEQIRAAKCVIVSISGTDDFNFTETAQHLFQQQTIPVNLKIELTDASHTWPDSLQIANSWGIARLSTAQVKSSEQTEKFCIRQHKRIETYQKEGELLTAALIARNMATSDPFKGDQAFGATYKIIQADPIYQAQLAKLEKCIRLEMNVRQPYIDAFQAKDSLWWRNEISVTDRRIQSEQDPFTQDMYRRIKAFWGIACFSICRQSVAAHDHKVLGKTLTIYRMLEPDNPDLFYYSAFISFWRGDDEATLACLKKAVELGFSDYGRLRKEFPATISASF